MSTDLHVVHWGGEHAAAPIVAGAFAWNGLAFDAYQSWAFRRAELTPFVESPFFTTNAKRVLMGQIRALEPQSFGAARIGAIVVKLLDEIIAFVAPLHGLRMAVVLGLAERFAKPTSRARQQRHHIEDVVHRRLARLSPAGVLQVLPKGHASFAYGVIEATAALTANKIDVALVGGVDSYYDPDVIQELIETHRIFDSENLDSFVPGEGGAFLALTRREIAKTARWPMDVRLESSCTNRELATLTNDVPNLALGLTRAARAISERLDKEHRTLDWWLTDMTAEKFRINEFQLAWPRAARGVMKPTAALEWMYEHFGDLGAAVMPTAAAIACEGFRRGDPQASTCVITGTSNDGDRGVVLLSHHDAR